MIDAPAGREASALAAISLLLSLLSGCGETASGVALESEDGSPPDVRDTPDSYGPPPTSEPDYYFGATAGGVQDLGLARELVAAGQVPPAEVFYAEGMFSEHDLSLSGDACEQTLCLRAAVGVSPNANSQSTAWLQVGLSSNIEADTFERPSTTLVAVVDVSGSMGWSYQTLSTEYPTPGGVARMLLRSFTSELDAADRFALVAYGGDAFVVLEPTAGDQQSAIHAAIDSLSSGGSTNMEQGITRGIAVAEGLLDGATDQTRMLLLTDVQPNLGATTASEFQQLARQAADLEIGLTVFGLGVGLGGGVMAEMASLRGGNAFSLFDFDDVETLMDDQWPWLFSPIAYDLNLEVTSDPSLDLLQTYGFPGNGGDPAILEVSTVFLSRRGGALLLAFSPDTQAVGEFAATVSLQYETPEGELVAEILTGSYGGEELDATGSYFQQPAVHHTVALARLVAAMRQGCELYATRRTDAIDVLEAASIQYAESVAELELDTLNRELHFAADLLSLMQQGAPQGSLYGN